MTVQSEFRPQRLMLRLPLSRPAVTWILLACIGVVFVIETLLGGSTRISVLVLMGAKVNALIADGQYWRLLTSTFLHVGILHLTFNAYALVVIGSDLERVFGPRRFLTIYLVSGLLGSLASYSFSPYLAAGASGAIFGLIGAQASFFLLYRDRLGAWGRTRLANVAFLIAANLFLGFAQRGIDNWAHLGGLLSGLALGWALAPRYEADPWELRLVDRSHPARFWLALLAAAAVLVAGTYLATINHRGGHI